MRETERGITDGEIGRWKDMTSEKQKVGEKMDKERGMEREEELSGEDNWSNGYGVRGIKMLRKIEREITEKERIKRKKDRHSETNKRKNKELKKEVLK